MDNIDFKIIKRLMQDGRITWSELGSWLGMSAPAIADRVRRMEENGTIKNFSVNINPASIGCNVTAFVYVILEHPRARPPFLQLVQDCEAIQECYHMAGEEDYCLKVKVANLAELESLISDRIKGIDGVIKTRTTIALSCIKETNALPVYVKFD